jgi:hypothetical protein
MDTPVAEVRIAVAGLFSEHRDLRPVGAFLPGSEVVRSFKAELSRT